MRPCLSPGITTRWYRRQLPNITKQWYFYESPDATSRWCLYVRHNIINRCHRSLCAEYKKPMILFLLFVFAWILKIWSPESVKSILQKSILPYRVIFDLEYKNLQIVVVDAASSIKSSFSPIKSFKNIYFHIFMIKR